MTKTCSSCHRRLPKSAFIGKHSIVNRTCHDCIAAARDKIKAKVDTCLECPLEACVHYPPKQQLEMVLLSKGIPVIEVNGRVKLAPSASAVQQWRARKIAKEFKRLRVDECPLEN